jgi:hypothetical protein
MPALGSKYRGTPKYNRVLAELLRAAEYRGVTTYQDIGLLMGLPLQGHHLAKETGQILGEISEDEHSAGRPMLSAVCVRVDRAGRSADVGSSGPPTWIRSSTWRPSRPGRGRRPLSFAWSRTGSPGRRSS